MGTVQDNLVAWMRGHIDYFHYSEGPLRLNPYAGGYTDCSGLLRLCFQSVAGVDIGTYTGNMQSHGSLICTDKNLVASLIRPGDCLIYWWNSNSPATGDHTDMFVGDSPQGNILSHGGPGVGPSWRWLSDRMKSCYQFEVRRFVPIVPVKPTSALLDVDGVAGPATFARASQIVRASREEYMVGYVQTQLTKRGMTGFNNSPLAHDGIGLYSNQFAETPATNTCHALLTVLGNRNNNGKFSYPSSSGVASWQSLLNIGKILP